MRTTQQQKDGAPLSRSAPPLSPLSSPSLLPLPSLPRWLTDCAISFSICPTICARLSGGSVAISSMSFAISLQCASDSLNFCWSDDSISRTTASAARSSDMEADGRTRGAGAGAVGGGGWRR